MKNLISITIFFTFWTCAYQAMSMTVLESSVTAETRHEQWMKEFGRSYEDDAEKEKRFKIFAEKLEYIERFNRDGNETYELGLNQFSDLTYEEFVSAYGCSRLENHLLESSIFNSSEIPTIELPKVPPKRKRSPPSRPPRPPKRRTPPSTPPTTGIPRRVNWREKGAVTIVKNQDKPKQCGNILGSCIYLNHYFSNISFIYCH